MINFYELEVRRAAIHTIIPKSGGAQHAHVEPDERLIDLDDNVVNLLIERLARTTQKAGKSFELEISDIGAATVFDYCEGMKSKSNEEFIHNSVEIAQLLARAQTKNSIPGGYLMVIEAVTPLKKSVYMIIKAELHDGLRYVEHSGKPILMLLDDVFFTPNTKLFKVGAIYEREEHIDFLNFPNNYFGCYLYDEQFNIDSKPAEYFYKDFLGFTTESNPKIQSKKFFETTDNFIKSYIADASAKGDLLQVLKDEFKVNDEPSVSPKEFAAAYFHDDEVRDAYTNEIATYLPQKIDKDASLFRSKLETKKVTFPNGITVSGPEKTFNISVQVIRTKEELDKIDFDNRDYTILRVIGNPYGD